MKKMHPSADISNVNEAQPLIAPGGIIDEVDNDHCCQAKVCFPDAFWDYEKGWMKFWNPALTWRQLTVRERESSFFAFDAFRALAFLWVQNDHVQEGMR